MLCRICYRTESNAVPVRQACRRAGISAAAPAAAASGRAAAGTVGPARRRRCVVPQAKQNYRDTRLVKL